MKIRGNKYGILIIILIIVIHPSFGLNYYEANKIKDFKNGSGKNNLWYLFPTPSYPYLRVPGYFMITSDEEIVITDQDNQRIVIYDINFNYKKEKEIPADSILGTCGQLLIDKRDNIVGVSIGFGIEKVNDKMEVTFKKYANNVPREVLYGKNFFLFEDKILYYDDELKIHMLNSSGEEIPATEIELIVEEMKKKRPGTIRNQEINDYLDENNLVLFGDRLLNANSDIVYKYFQYIQMTMNNKRLINKISTIKSYTIQGFIGFDRNDNSYWNDYHTNNTWSTVVLSKYGEVLDHFKDFSNYTHKAVAPNGDIYYLFFNKETRLAEVYTIPRRWGLDQDWGNAPHEAPKPPKALFITATSFIDWKNTYTPAKAFDGNLKTGWLEAAKGPGTGESITLTLDREITVDEIKIAPGYFDPKWWKSNNRVKDLKVIYGNKSLVLHFKDVMQMQKAKLNKDIYFSSITFEITGVFPSGKDNDTGISEIEFYHKGKKVEIDVSRVK